MSRWNKNGRKYDRENVRRVEGICIKNQGDYCNKRTSAGGNHLRDRPVGNQVAEGHAGVATGRPTTCMYIGGTHTCSGPDRTHLHDRATKGRHEGGWPGLRNIFLWEGEGGGHFFIELLVIHNPNPLNHSKCMPILCSSNCLGLLKRLLSKVWQKWLRVDVHEENRFFCMRVYICACVCLCLSVCMEGAVIA